ncbi:MAG: hypothetical protein NTV50_13410 [Planctomycetota bacterium]|nr:hypothetical protein [Planctomycetota bacterium]
MVILRFAFAFLLLLCLTFSFSFGQDKDKKAEDKNAKADPKEKWIPVGQVVAILKEVRESDKSVVISIQTQGYSPQAKRFVAKMESHTLFLKDDVKIRLLNPPDAFDDKGRAKKYTPKELKELKGDDLKTPGYPADFSDLKNDSIVNLTLMQKPLKPVRGGATGLVGVAGKKDDPELARELGPKISSIVILGVVPDNAYKR